MLFADVSAGFFFFWCGIDGKRCFLAFWLLFGALCILGRGGGVPRLLGQILESGAGHCLLDCGGLSLPCPGVLRGRWQLPRT